MSSESLQVPFAVSVLAKSPSGETFTVHFRLKLHFASHFVDVLSLHHRDVRQTYKLIGKQVAHRSSAVFDAEIVRLEAKHGDCLGVQGYCEKSK